MAGGDEEHRAAHPRHQLEAVAVEEVVGDLHVVLDAEPGAERAGAAAVVLEVAAEDRGGGVRVGALAERR